MSIVAVINMYMNMERRYLLTENVHKVIGNLEYGFLLLVQIEIEVRRF